MPARTARRARLGRPRKKDQRPGSLPTRERILEAASHLFARHGHERTTMGDVARGAGLTVGALYRHFDGKPDLLLAVVAAALERIPAFQAEADHSGDPLPAAIGMYVTPELEEVRRLGRELHGAARRDARVRRLLADFNRKVRAAAAGRIRSIPEADPVGGADLAADVLLVIVLGLAHLDTLAPDRVDRPRFRAAVEAAVERILGT